MRRIKVYEIFAATSVETTRQVKVFLVCGLTLKLSAPAYEIATKQHYSILAPEILMIFPYRSSSLTMNRANSSEVPVLISAP